MAYKKTATPLEKKYTKTKTPNSGSYTKTATPMQYKKTATPRASVVQAGKLGNTKKATSLTKRNEKY